MEDLAMLPVVKSNRMFPGLMGEFLNDDFFNNFIDRRPSYTVPAVNIVETKNDFRIEVAAPGLDKADFKINIEDDILVISAEKEAKKETNEDKFVRREFSYNSFKRAFSLPEDVDKENIGATHKEGILTVSIPKKDEKKLPLSRNIAIS
jgi:HSP20 family protein